MEINATLDHSNTSVSPEMRLETCQFHDLVEEDVSLNSFSAKTPAPRDPLTPEQTLILLDWDDTIFPSSWCSRRDLSLSDDVKPNEEEWSLLTTFAEEAVRTLQELQLMGTVVFVTNAETGWIEMSCQKFLPALMVEVKNLSRISARSTFEPMGVKSPVEWKTRAFQQEIANFYDDESTDDKGDDCSSNSTVTSLTPIRNIISVGDSAHERNAIMKATENCTNCRTKSLKLLERPEIHELKEQHELIVSFLRSIAGYNGNIDLCVRCT